MNPDLLPSREVANKMVWTLMFLIYSGAVFYLAVRPIQEGAPVIGIRGMDKLIHMGEFTLYVLLGYRTVKYYIKQKRTIYFLAVISLAYGSLTELSQLFFSYRTASALDWFANVIGITTGLIIIFLYRKKKPRNLRSR